MYIFNITIYCFKKKSETDEINGSLIGTFLLRKKRIVHSIVKLLVLRWFCLFGNKAGVILFKDFVFVLFPCR